MLLPTLLLSLSLTPSFPGELPPPATPAVPEADAAKPLLLPPALPDTKGTWTPPPPTLIPEKNNSWTPPSPTPLAVTPDATTKPATDPKDPYWPADPFQPPTFPNYAPPILPPLSSPPATAARCMVPIENTTPAVPFTSMPTIEPITHYPAHAGKLNHADSTDPATKSVVPLFDARFALPARFDYPQFGAAGEVIPTEGVVIYESMRFSVQPNGEYELIFVMSTPKMPVNLRLQLQVFDNNKDSIFITIPPICTVPAPVEENTNCLMDLWQVRHRGYSGFLATSFDDLRLVTRQGVATFGSLPRTK
jgi:hypothetical protein